MDSFLLGIRLALRRHAAAPSRTTFAILTLSLGIGATTAMFAVVDAVLLRPLPFSQPETLRQIWRLQGTSRSHYLSPESVKVWGSRSNIFAAIEPFRIRAVALLGSGEPQLIPAAEIGGGLMTMLGVPARLGRSIQPQDVANDAAVVVLGDAVWRTRFASDPGVVGRSVRLDGRAYEIVGVMPSSFRFPREQQQLWIPLTSAPSRPLHAVARLQTEIAEGDVRSAIASTVSALERDLPTSGGWEIDVRPLGGERVNASERTALFLLLGAVGCVMLIACANVSSLLLVETTGREREFAVRVAIGASRSQLLRLILEEIACLAVVAGGLGLLLALWAVDLLAAYTPREFTFLSAAPIELELRVLSFTILITVSAAALVGALPAWRAATAPVRGVLSCGARTATSSRQQYLQRSFVVAQLAMTLLLLLGTGLMVRTFFFVTAVDRGFDTRNLIVLQLSLPTAKYTSRAAQVYFFDELCERVNRIAGVVAVSAAGGTPPTGGGLSDGLRFEIDGLGVALEDPFLLLSTADVRPEYFSTLRIPILAGRTFSADDAADGPSPVVINRALARRLWKDANPVGARIRFHPDGSWHTVLGVVGDVYQVEYEEPAGILAAYFPERPTGRPTAQETLIVRTATEPDAIIPQIRQAVWAIDADQPILKVATMNRLYAEFLGVPRFQALLMTGVGLTGLLIAAIGVYGLVASATARRTREFGIRIALGATPRDVLRMTLLQAATMIGLGVTLGLLGGFAVGRAMKSLLVGVAAQDPVTYLVVVAGTSVTALVACWVPARRAARANPISALRAE